MAATLSPQCATCSVENVLVISCQSGQHTFCLDCVTTCLRSRTDTANLAAGLTAGLSCPLTERCGSQLEFSLLQDILDQTPGPTELKSKPQLSLSSLAVNGALRRNARVACPNEECSFFFVTTEDGSPFQDLFLSCPNCEKDSCLTCKHVLSSQGYSDHICPTGEDIADSDANQRLHEVLTAAVAVRCPNKHCGMSDRAAPLTGKEPGDCNAIECTQCQRFFCFICSLDLGQQACEAHTMFPHRNVNIPDAPHCWLFEDEELEQTDEKALHMRQVHAVSVYMASLQISDRRKKTLLDNNREVLGELFTYFTTRNGKKNIVSCNVM